MSTEQDAWTRLLLAIEDWADNHMDQWEMFRIDVKRGPLFVTLSHATEYPDDPEFERPVVAHPPTPPPAPSPASPGSTDGQRPNGPHASPEAPDAGVRMTG